MENINDLIYAYSLGCLDNEELQRLREHLNSGENHNIQELGEFQNLVSLLPSTLKIENPDPQLKDNVAKKLYRLKDEIRAQRQKNKPLPNVQEATGEKVQDSSLEEQERLKTEFKAINSASAEENDAQEWDEGPIDLSSNMEIPLFRPMAPIKKNSNIMIFGVVLFFLLAIGITLTYMNISLKTGNLANEVDKLKKDLGNLNIKLISNQEIQEMIQSPEVQVINLRGTSINPNSFGKLIIGSDKGAGYIKLAQMPAIQEDKIFQLWVSISGSYLSLKTIQSSDTRQ